jgi:hypothetical protein
MYNWLQHHIYITHTRALFSSKFFCKKIQILRHIESSLWRMHWALNTDKNNN